MIHKWLLYIGFPCLYYPLMRAYLLAARLAAPTILQAQTVDPRLIPILEGSVERSGFADRAHLDRRIQRFD